MPRAFALAAVLLVLGRAGPTAAAQEATPAAPGSLLAAMGYPELRVRVTDEGTEAPREVDPGIYLVVLENASRDFADATIAMPPPDLSLDDLLATPPAEDEGTAPEWLYEATIAGGAAAPPGGTGQIVVGLVPGEWAIFVSREPGEGGATGTPEAAEATPQVGPAEAEEGREEAVPLTVTEGGATPAADQTPAAAVTVEMRDFAFAMPERLPEGPQVWEVTNAGEQPHFIVVAKGPDTLTMEQVMAILAAEAAGGTPPAGVPNPETDFQDAGFVSVMSAGRTAWVEFDLAPGTYVAVCFFPDRETQAPHAALGMAQVFTVGDGAATPAA